MQFSVKIMYPNGQISYLSYRNRTAWGRRTALKHLREFLAKSFNPPGTGASLEIA
jgi:hypothetical protein